MKQSKVWLQSILIFLIFFAGLGFYVYKTQSSQSREQSSLKKDSSRMLEKSSVKSKVDKVVDEPSALFNDPAISQAWGLKKSDAIRAWQVSKGDHNIVVAIIDTGIDEVHEDIAENLWVNPGETGKDSLGRDKASNGIDDDNNGFVDDVHGWNFVSNNNKLDDNHGHGTHIACIVGARAGNGKGIIGISPEVSLMVLKYYDPKVPGADNLKNTVASIRYAVQMGANIINYSGGGTEFSQEEHDAVAEAERKGVLFVAAAGNERSNSDQHHYYPADYKLKNIISVTAIDPSTQVLSSSNFGVETVDIAAPGQNILSCLPGNSYGYMTGTSQATAFVTGAASLVMAHMKSFTVEEVKKYILSTGDAVTELATKTKTSRQLNLFKALTILDQGVAANGVKIVNESKVQSFSSDSANLKDKNNGQTQVPSSMSQFSQSLLNAIEAKEPKDGKKKTRLGTQNRE